MYCMFRFSGIYSVNVDYSQQRVTVWGICNKYGVLETVRSKRKEARFWNPEDNVTPAKDREPEQLPPPEVPKPNPNPKASSLVMLSKAGRSLSWKAWKRLIFTRSNSFWWDDVLLGQWIDGGFDLNLEMQKNKEEFSNFLLVDWWCSWRNWGKLASIL